jgi:heterodisulfide reductase subunit C
MSSKVLTLRQLVRNATGQDLNHCQACMDCEFPYPEEIDIPISSMVQMVLFDDDEILTSRLLWSDMILKSAKGVCKRGLDLQAVMLALREEAKQRGLNSEIQ